MQHRPAVPVDGARALTVERNNVATLAGRIVKIQVRERFPTLPIVVTSGYNDVVAPEGAAFPMLRKPVAYEELQRVVRAGLEGAAA